MAVRSMQILPILVKTPCHDSQKNKPQSVSAEPQDKSSLGKQIFLQRQTEV